MPTPDPTIYLMLHHGHDEISVFGDAEGRNPIEEIHVSAGGQINVEFINNHGNSVMTGKIRFGVAQNGTSPFDPPRPDIDSRDNGQGNGNRPIRAEHPAKIARGMRPGNYPFLICGTWDNGRRKVDNDPIVVIDY